MANTLTSLIPDCYAALDVVSRELTGAISAVTRDSRADRVAAGETLRSIVAPANTAGADITPAMSLPSAANQTIGNKTLTITKNRFFPFSWNGQEQMAMDKGPGYLTIQQNQIAQAIRAAVNEIEADVCSAAASGISRSFGATAGVAPLFTDWAQAKKILDDNGAPQTDRHSIINTTAGVALRSTANLYKVNEGGEGSLLRQGVLGNLYGFDIRESAQITAPTVGTGTLYVINGAHSVGATSVVIKTGSGTVLAGDIVIIGSHKYTVATGVAAAGTIVINAPGLQAAAADGASFSIFAASAKNFALSRNAIVLATRLPEVPVGGDLAIDRAVITDDRTGLSFEIAMYPGFRMNTYHVSCSWGVACFKPEHIAGIVG